MYDGKRRSFTWDKFIGKMRQAFRDLGPADQMSEQRKVNVSFLLPLSVWAASAMAASDCVASDRCLQSNSSVA
mgnify:CR=1 FL=1